MNEEAGLYVPREHRRGSQRSDERWIPKAVALLDLLARSLGLDDLSSEALLDVGCGTKFAATIVNQGVPIRRYVGVDTDASIIEYLDENIHDPRLSFHHLDAHNEMYNPTGKPLESYARLPIPEERFDVISLFSVFTHLAPHDYRAMLEVLRPHVADTGGLLFSLFVDDVDPAIRDAFNRELKRRREAGDPDVEQAIRDRQAGVTDFVDRVPDRPLLEAVYSERYARELIDGTGWSVEALHQPIRDVIQHHFVCRPI